MKRALIDTDILSYYFKGNPKVIDHFEANLEHFDFIEISLITYYEIASGLLAKKAFKLLESFEQFVNDNKIIPLTQKSSRISAELYSSLRQTGNIIDDIDLLIAGVAIENELTLVTNNHKYFSRIPNLNIENWTQ
ncbi:MAG: type II toxin-antitoxin system VapC family toxin [Bacteroidales bacterium]|nr:type II toxin-antitoxin system VapC family toxin [Bacteroidales bacterium]